MVKFRPLFTIFTDAILLATCLISFLVNFLSFKRLARSKKQISRTTPTSSSKLEKVSVIIAIRNEARYIGKTLQNLESTTVDKARVQIVLVDCGCKDNSIDVAKVVKYRD